jgi:type IV pilus assembly protein PilB
MSPTQPRLTPPPRGHWLKEVAGHVGLDLQLSEQPDFQELSRAWPEVARACRMSDEAFTQRLAGYFRVGLADLGSYDPQAVKLVPEALARRYGILPLSATEGTVVVAAADPANRAAQRDIAAYAGRQPVFLVASPSKLAQTLERAYAPARAPRNTLQTLVAQVAESDFKIITNQGGGLFATSLELEDPPLVKLTNFLLQTGLRYRATEIHVEPGQEQGRVRFRIDGVLQHVVDLPRTAQQRVTARLKHMARTQPGVKPEDGFPVRGDGVEKRALLSTTPSPDGELVWLRLHDPHDVPSLEGLGFDGLESEKIRGVLAKRDGLVLVTGPARSGTTSFVYAALHSFAKQSVISLEGRPEIVVPGVTQIRYDVRSGLSFAESLQQLLERSPDVLHAGEIRDLATARIVLRSAMTGRKVLATLHTSDAVSGVRRMVDMGLAPARLAESLHAVISLRLIRRLCERCTRPFDPEKDAKAREATLASLLGVRPVRLGVGCQSCAGTGFMGQIPVPEVMVVTPELREVLSGSPSDDVLLRAARAAGMRTFLDIGLENVAEGKTTIEELERVLGCVPTRDQTAEAAGAVLLVEDEIEDRQIVGATLRQMGFRVLEVDGTEAAREKLKSDEEFSLVILDVYLPDYDGPDLLRGIRRSLTTQSLPVIVVTGSDNPMHEFDLLDAGADDYLLKPVAVDRLESRVRAVLRRAGVRIEAGKPVTMPGLKLRPSVPPAQA